MHGEQINLGFILSVFCFPYRGVERNAKQIRLTFFVKEIGA
jgi:hypothetical protein